MLDFECWMQHIIWESSIISLSIDQGICVSYLAQVEFEFPIWAWVQATAGTAIGSGDHHQFSFLQLLTQYFIVCLCIQMSGGKKATAEIAISNGHHQQLLFWQWLRSQAQVVNSNSTSAVQDPQQFWVQSQSYYINWVTCYFNFMIVLASWLGDKGNKCHDIPLFSMGISIILYFLSKKNMC